MKSFWLLVGNGSRARLFAGEGPTAALEEIECFVNVEGRQPERLLVSDRPGRFRDEGSGHSADETHWSEAKLREFAQMLSDFLGTAHAQNRFQRLSVIASPKLLGMLRDTLPGHVEDVVLEEIDKDLVWESPGAIQSHLQRLAS
jgi:protein required for attachment to host cells